jgi:hypothetical protein
MGAYFQTTSESQAAQGAGAQGIVAETPPELHWQFRGVGTVEREERSAPRFFAVCRKKCVIYIEKFKCCCLEKNFPFSLYDRQGMIYFPVDKNS